MSSLPRPTIVILDAFDLFTTHARQALLYCLLDTVQSCRAGEGRKGVAVVGVTTRVVSAYLRRLRSRLDVTFSFVNTWIRIRLIYSKSGSNHGSRIE